MAGGEGDHCVQIVNLYASQRVLQPGDRLQGVFDEQDLPLTNINRLVQDSESTCVCFASVVLNARSDT